MSHSSSITIQYNIETQALEVLQSLINFGWVLNDHNSINILPINDNDLFNWTRFNLAEESLVQEIINQKQILGELVGFSLTWKDTNIGGDFLVRPKETTFIPTIYRQILADCGRFTDISWYLSKLIPPLSSLLIIESIACEEYV